MCDMKAGMEARLRELVGSTRKREKMGKSRRKNDTFLVSQQKNVD